MLKNRPLPEIEIKKIKEIKEAVVPSFTGCCPDFQILKLMDRNHFWLISEFHSPKKTDPAAEPQEQIPQLLPNIS